MYINGNLGVSVAKEIICPLPLLALNPASWDFLHKKIKH
jgi:hypothetical protein